jgi:5-formyltetrahydrofolate cyclo-ligase
MTSLAQIKAAARKVGFARRKAAFDAAGPGQAAHLSEVLAGYRGVALSGYMPIRTEINPLPAMEEAAAHGPVGVPVITGEGQPLLFSRWEPGCAMTDGPFGAQVPAAEDYFEPEIVIVPLVAFDRAGGRLGYGGGFYDRTLEKLRAKRPTLAIGFAFAAQETESVPLEATDQPLDLLITESEIITF